MCPTCLRPQRTCICHWIAPTAHAVEVLVLQHPLEVPQAKGSARLLCLSLPHSRIVVGEAFTQPPWPADGKHTLLLYPDTPQDTAADLSPPPALPAAWLQHPVHLRLVVLDGTWRKSRKMLYSSPPLQQLPRLALRGLPPSHYRIRKAHLPDQLSTLEATCAALAQLEGDAERFAPLLAAFDGFVAQQAALIYDNSASKRTASMGDTTSSPSLPG
jgi:DTW domain-containing protein YfiP